jgi:hypothetical protein
VIWILANIRILTLAILVGNTIFFPTYAFCGNPPTVLPTVLPTVVEGKAPPKKAVVKNLRCPDDKPWTDEVVAKSIKVPVERLKALKSARSMTNDQVCTFPEPMLQRAWKKLDTVKADLPNEWAEFYNLRRRSDDGMVRADGLIRGFEHRRAVLRKIAEKRSGVAPGGSNMAGEERTASDQAGNTQTTIDIPESGVDVSLAGISSNQWTEIGPVNIGGRIRAVIIDPDNTNNIWAGGVSGGIYKSTNYGVSFSPVNDFMANLAISSIVMDPTNHNTMYAGTGEGFFNADGVRGYGAFKSTDRGVTWNLLTATTPSSNINDYAFGWYYVNRLAISNNGATIMAATRGYYPNFGGSIYRSTDGGGTWSQRYTAARVWDVLFDPNDPSKAIASVSNKNTGTGLYENSIIISVDGGLSWTIQKTFAVANSVRIELAYAKANSQIVYASVDQNSGDIWKSIDGGTTWTYMANPQHLGNQGWYDNTIWVDPSDATAQLVLAAGLDVYSSTNGGTTWSKISNWGQNQTDIRYGSGTSHTPHADHHALVSDPNYNGTTNRVLYNSNDGGLYRAPDITLAGQTSGWDELNNGIAMTQFYSVAGQSSGGTRIVGGSQDNGMLRTDDNGTSWKMFNGGDGGFGAVDSADDHYLYGEYVYLQICRSTDRGSSTSYIDKTGASQLTDARASATANFIAPFLLDPNNNNRMLAGGVSLWLNNAVRTGTSWSSIKASTGSKISAIAVAQGRIVNRIIIDKDDSTKGYVSYGGYNNNNLWRGTNSGTTWTDLNSPNRVIPSVPIFSLARHPLNANWLYAGTEVGLFTSQDGGTTWSTSNDGPANVEIADLAWRDNTTIIAATHGRGMFLASSCGNQPVKNPGIPAYYWTIQSAYDAAGYSQTIQMQTGDFGEDLTLANANPVILRGGYSCDYSTNSGFTNVHGKVIVKGGVVTVEKMVIK